MTKAQEDRLGDEQFACTRLRKEPPVDASHVRNAVARFDQVENVSDDERDDAWRSIQSAAKWFGVELSENSWRQLSHGGRPKHGS